MTDSIPTQSSKTDAVAGAKRKERYCFFLNPYTDIAFTRCPKCETITRIKKFCLVIHIEPHYFISLNKTCRYCSHCDMIIVKKAKLESLLAGICGKLCPEITGNDYTVCGTMDRPVWKLGQRKPLSPAAAIEQMCIFKAVLNFAVHGGWVPPANACAGAVSKAYGRQTAKSREAHKP